MSTRRAAFYSAWVMAKQRLGHYSTVALAVLLAACLHTQGVERQAGSQAPGFTLSSHTGATVDLADHAGKRSVVVVFYRGHW